MNRIVIAAASTALVSLLVGAVALAQTDYPNRPVRLVVAVAPGGGIDTASRMVAEGLRPILGQTFVIENHGGAAGNIGAAMVFGAPPDGYTLLGSSLTPITIADLLYKNLGFEPAALEPVAVMSRIPNVLLVRTGFPARTSGELVAHLKANPGKVTYASPGVGTAAQLTAELFMKVTGTKMVHIPYKGTAPSLNDLVGGHVDVTFAQLAASLPLHRDGKATILATATAKRLEALPEVPTLAEAGIAGVESDTWNAISAPPKTPAPVLAKLNAAIDEVLRSGPVQARFRAMYVLPGGGDLDGTRKYVKDETARWREVIRSAGIVAGN